MNRKVYTKPSIDVVITTTTPLLAGSGQYNDRIQYGGRLDGIKQFEDEPELTDINGTKWYTAE
jgi:hypothetical protein